MLDRIEIHVDARDLEENVDELIVRVALIDCPWLVLPLGLCEERCASQLDAAEELYSRGLVRSGV